MGALRLAVLGAGSWGTALAALGCQRADTVLWSRDAAQATAINRTHVNAAYLPGITLPEGMRVTADFHDAINHVLGGPPEARRLLILGVPMAGLDDVCQRTAQALPANHPLLHILWICKGIEPDTHQWPHELVARSLLPSPRHPIGVLSGPSFAREVALGLPVALTVASACESTGSVTQAIFHGAQARIYTTQDIIGVEVGGALKNVMAIACGINDGLSLGTNARAALITRGLAEIQRLGVALGGRADTFIGLTGLGDLVLTATGDLSRNRHVGLAIAQGQPLATILAGGMTAEGVRCAEAALALGRAHGLDLPITEAVCSVLFQGVTPHQAVASLLAREAGPE